MKFKCLLFVCASVCVEGSEQVHTCPAVLWRSEDSSQELFSQSTVFWSQVLFLPGVLLASCGEGFRDKQIQEQKHWASAPSPVWTRPSRGRWGRLTTYISTLRRKAFCPIPCVKIPS